MKVFVADRDVQSLRSLESELNKDPNDPSVFTAECDVADWESQKRAFETAIDTFPSGRIDYVFPIAGIGERRSFPNRPTSKEFEKPDLSVVEVDEIGVIYTVSLAVQHFRRLEVKGDGFRGKSEYPMRVRWEEVSALLIGAVVAVASVCGFYIHKPIPLCTAAKQYVSSSPSAELSIIGIIH